MPSGASDPAASWLEISVESGAEAVEAVSEILDRVGYRGIAVDVPLDEGRPHLVKAYVPYDRAARFKVRRVKEAIGHLRAFDLGELGDVGVRRIADEDWLETWRAQFQPVRIGAFFVRPSWSEARAEGTEIVLDPGMAFGTGLHPTTRQCLEAVGRLDLRGRSVLDVGTGSGILAIAAAKRGARPVAGVDVDPLAVRAAVDNARRNEVRVEVREGGAADVAGAFDVVLANLVADVLVAIAPDLRARCARGATLVCAGIVGEKEDAAAAALRAEGFIPAEREQQGDWVSLVLRAP